MSFKQYFEVAAKKNHWNNKEQAKVLLTYLNELDKAGKLEASDYEDYFYYDRSNIEWPEDLPQYDNVDYKQFVYDMVKAELEVRHYNGRFFYKGPGVIISDIQEVLSNTEIKCKWDNMGLDFIVYPG